MTVEEVAPPTCEVAGFHLLHSSLNVYFLYVLYSLDLWHRLLLLKMLRYCGLRSSIDYVVQVGSQPLSKVSGRHLPLRSSVACAFEHGAIAVPRPLDKKKKKKKVQPTACIKNGVICHHTISRRHTQKKSIKKKP